MYTLSDFDFDLPERLIAQEALPVRHASRLLEVPVEVHVEANVEHAIGHEIDDESEPEKKFCDRSFIELVDCLEPGDLLVFNNTQVMKARFFGHKHSGGKIEILIEKILDEHTALAQIRASKSPKPGTMLRLADAFDVSVIAREGEFYVLNFPSACHDLMAAYGHLPLPPYIAHQADAYDEKRYQTIFAESPGAVAAPTASLHFDELILKKLEEKGINYVVLTLHVGAGTFSPVRSENIEEHVMHSEWYHLPQSVIDAIATTRQLGRHVVAVGTTTLRALESAAQLALSRGLSAGQLFAGDGTTDIFIKPGYDFQIVDRLVTNFHLPRSTLLILVSAFCGFETIQKAYQHAIQKEYRFFSYGDAMLLTRQNMMHKTSHKK